jgi:hypothetical protein
LPKAIVNEGRLEAANKRQSFQRDSPARDTCDNSCAKNLRSQQKHRKALYPLGQRPDYVLHWNMKKKLCSRPLEICTTANHTSRLWGEPVDKHYLDRLTKRRATNVFKVVSR